MSVKFERTRKKLWESGFIYFLPTIRYHWDAERKNHDLSAIWLTFKLSVCWKS